jgi:hypothetical protein
MNISPRLITDGLIFCVDGADRNSLLTSSPVSWKDLVNQNNGAITGASFNSSAGGCLSFNGTANSTYVTVTDATVLRPANFTISIWVKFNALTAYSALTAKAQNGPPWANPYASYILRLTGTGGGIEFFIGASGSGNFTYGTADYTFNTTSWFNVVFYYDSTNAYIDINDSTILTTPCTRVINYTSNPIIIGAEAGSSAASEVLNGLIGHFSMYNRSLTKLERSNNYITLKSRFGR